MRTTLATVCFWVGMSCAVTAALLLALSVIEGIIEEAPISDRLDRPTHSVRLFRATAPAGVVCLLAWALLRPKKVSPPSQPGTSRR